MKRGQTNAAGTAVLLAIIAGLIVLFVLFLQPQDRARVLGEPIPARTGTTPDELGGASVQKNLLQEQPGTIDFLTEQEIEHPLPVITVYTTTDTELLAERSTAVAKRSAFSEEQGRMTFHVPEVARTEDVLLAFAVKEAKGQLFITLNGEEIYQAQVTPGNLHPIPLPQELLKDENELVFQVSSPGLAFWATNEISLQNIRVVADVTDVGARTSRNMFLISPTERDTLERVRLKFQPACEFREVGPLEVLVNGNSIYNAVPDCDAAFVPLEFSPGIVKEGENELLFRTSKGTYVLSHVILISELKEVDFPTYYFELTSQEYQSIVEGTRRLRLEMNFVDVRNSKLGDLVFNGHLRHFDTKDTSLSMDLGDDAVRGSNSLKIKPRRTLEVRQLRVDLVR